MMSQQAETPQQFLDALAADRKNAVTALRAVILENLPLGFEEVISQDMLNYVVPHALYPGGYHVNPALPLPFISLASQKNYIALYHMGLYANKPLLEWFHEAWASQSKTKLDMGKSCIRLKKPEQIPYQLIGELASKVSPQEWIAIYEHALKK